MLAGLLPRLLFIASLTLVPLAAQESLVAVDLPVLNIDSHETGTAVITLRNTGSKPVPLHLRLTDFVHTHASKSYALGTSSTLEPLGPADRADYEREQITNTLHLKLSVTHVWEAGQSTAVLKNGEADIPTTNGAAQCVVTAMRIPAAFNVQLDSAATGTPQIVFSKFGSTLVKIINADPMNYSFHWQVREGNRLTQPANASFDLPANGSAYVDLSGAAPSMSILDDGTIKDEVSAGELILHPDLDASVGIPPLAPKVLPVSIRLEYWGGGLQEAVTIVCVFILLTLGGMASIWVHCGMPNTESALAKIRAIDALQVKLDGIGPEIPSRTRAMLAGHIEKLRECLKSTWWVFPAFAAKLDEAEKQTAMVSQWIDVSYGVAEVLHDAAQRVQSGFPPTVLHWIKAKCACALSHFESGFTTPGEIEHMKEDLTLAQNYLTLATNASAIPELEKTIQEREAQLGPRLAAIDLAMPGRFTATIAKVQEQVNEPLTASNYLDRDTLSLKVDLIGQVCELINRACNVVVAAAAAVGGAPPLAAPVDPDTALGRLRRYQERFIAYIQPDAPETLRLAWLLVNEMRQDIYEPALLKEVSGDSPQLSIVIMPSDCACDATSLLSLKFKRELLNEAAACQEWTCVWDFGDGSMQETGWEVYHGYRHPGRFKVSVSITNLNGDAVLHQPFVTEVTAGGPEARRHWSYRLWKRARPHAETMLEASRLGMVLTLAVFGLVGPAQHQVESLTLIQAAGAVFALGFGADTLKNLITKRGAT